MDALSIRWRHSVTVLKKLLIPVISVKEMLKELFGAVLSILQSWEFSKISTQNPGNGISETLDSNILWGSIAPYPPRISRVFSARPPHFEKASAGPVFHLYLHVQIHWAIPFIMHTPLSRNPRILQQYIY